MYITINNEQKEIKVTFRADILFENIMDKTFNGSSVTEWLVYMYAAYLASNPNDNPIELDEFIEWVDADRQTLFNFVEYYTKAMVTANKLRPQSAEEAKN